jgi:hypothetical protein
MNPQTKQEFEEFVNNFFDNGIEITMTDYEKTDVGIHIGLTAYYVFTFHRTDFQGRLPFHLNIFDENGVWEFKPLFEQIHFITNILDPLEYENFEQKKINLPIVISAVMGNKTAIKDKMIEMNNVNKFD